MSFRFARALVALVALCISAGPAAAQSAASFPSKTIRFIVPLTPGGSPDVMARTIGQRLQDVWGQPIVVENRPGGGGNIGAEAVIKSPADGYTWLLAPHNVMVTNPYFTKTPWDPLKDLAPVSVVAKVPFMLVVHPSVQANSVKELIALAKANPGKLNYGSSGTGQPQHLGGELFNSLAGTQIVHVPYKGAVPAVTDLLAGRIQVWIGAINTLLPHIKAGSLRVLGAVPSKRYASFPDIPTIAEAGLPGYDMDVWLATMVPTGVPADIIAKIQAEIAKTLAQPEIREKLAQQGIEASSSTTAELATLIREDYARYGKLIKDAGIKAD
jgi:tripartite-type tricarboxylate transporter receptor subunit TctC